MSRFDVSQASALIRAARADAGLSQAALAERAGLRQPSLAQMETGRRRASPEMLERVLRAADYRPSLPLAREADRIRAAARARHLSNVRVFGSASRGDDGFDSDIDLLVAPADGADLFDLAAFGDDVRRLTGFDADVVSDASSSAVLDRARDEAIPL